MNKTTKQAMEEKSAETKLEDPAVNVGLTPPPQKKIEYDPKELEAIFDEILFNGDYYEDVTIKGKLVVKFKSRTTKDVSDITATADSLKFNMFSSLAEYRALQNLSRSLMAYNGRDLSGLKVEERLAFINKLNATVTGILLDKLSEFDAKVYQACKDGEENF